MDIQAKVLYFFPFGACISRSEKDYKGKLDSVQQFLPLHILCMYEFALLCLPVVFEGLICLPSKIAYIIQIACQKCLGQAGIAVVALC